MPPKRRANSKGNVDQAAPKQRKIKPPVNVPEIEREAILSHVRDHVDALFINELTPAFTKAMYNSEWTKVYDMFRK